MLKEKLNGTNINRLNTVFVYAQQKITFNINILGIVKHKIVC
jgi:hypothetical protein